MSTFQWLLIGLGVFVLLFSIPLALGLVKPNWFFGVRTFRTMSSPSVWHAANRFAGFAGFPTAAAYAVLAFTVADLVPEWAHVVLSAGPLLVWAVTVLVYTARIPDGASPR